MKQIIQSYKTGKMILAEVPIPGCRDNGILVQTKSSLVSAGTEKLMIDLAKKSLIGKAKSRPDLVKQVLEKVKRDGLRPTIKKVFTKLDSPVPLGYSCAGEVIMSGKNVMGVSKGDRVACAGAGYASHSEINFIPKNLFTKIPDSVSFEIASFATVGAIALQGVRQLNPTIGEKIAVIGSGLIGQITIQLLKANGCDVIAVDIDKNKLILAKEMGTDETSLSNDMISAVEGFSNGIGVDGVILTASTKSKQIMHNAGEICRMKGKIIIVGMFPIEIPRDIYYKKELECKLSMSYGPGRYDPIYEEQGVDYPLSYVRWTEQRNLKTIIRLIEQRKITPDKLITHRFSFNDAIDAYKLLTGETKEPYLGIVLNYAEEVQKPSILNISQEGKISDIELALVGAGNFSQSIALPILEKMDINLNTLVDYNSTITAHIGKKYKFNFISSSVDDAFQNERINTIMVTTPHNIHSKLVIESLKAGKNVFVEKPLAIKEEELEQVKEAYEKFPKHLMVGFNRRFSSHAKKIKEFISNNSTPLVMNYVINAGDIPPEHWAQNPDVGGGRIIGELCHFLDFLQFISNSKPNRVFAVSLKTDNKKFENDDSVHICISYEDGSIGNITYHAVGDKSLPKEFFEVSADNKTVKMYNFYITELYKNGHKSKYHSKGQDKGFAQEYQQFFDSIINNTPSPISFESLYLTTLSTFIIIESIKTGLALSIK